MNPDSYPQKARIVAGGQGGHAAWVTTGTWMKFSESLKVPPAARPGMRAGLRETEEDLESCRVSWKGLKNKQIILNWNLYGPLVKKHSRPHSGEGPPGADDKFQSSNIYVMFRNEQHILNLLCWVLSPWSCELKPRWILFLCHYNPFSQRLLVWR